MVQTSPRPEQLPFILELLDDETPTVREAVIAELRAYGSSLETELSRLPQPPSEEQIRQIDELLGRNRAERKRQRAGAIIPASVMPPPPPPPAGASVEAADGFSTTETEITDWLLDNWADWMQEDNANLQLERGLSLVSGFVSNTMDAQRVGEAIDGLALEFSLQEHALSELELSKFLFQEKGLKGVSHSSSYYSPESSDLVSVIEQGQGIPISLCCIYRLAGARLGLDIHGVNTPRHFLAAIRADNQRLFIDCFDKGRVYTARKLEESWAGALTSGSILERDASPHAILGRVLRNLALAYSLSGSEERSRALLHLIEQHDRRQF